MKAIFYDWGGFNVWLFHLINQIHAGYYDQFMLLGTILGDHKNFPLYMALASLAALTVASQRGERASFESHTSRPMQWLAVLAVFSAAYVIEGWVIGFLKPMLDFPRPPLALPLGSVIIVGTPEFHHSLPSGHSSFAMLVCASLWPVLNRPFKMIGVLFIAWVGISRISLGAHFPADVAAGFLLSILVVWAVRRLVYRLGYFP